MEVARRSRDGGLENKKTIIFTAACGQAALLSPFTYSLLLLTSNRPRPALRGKYFTLLITVFRIVFAGRRGRRPLQMPP